MKERKRERNLCVVGADTDMIFPSDDDLLRFHWTEDYGAVLVKAGVFASVKAAWLAGFRDQIPTGWNEQTINGFKVYIYNPMEVRWADGTKDDEDRYDLPWGDEATNEYGNALDLGNPSRYSSWRA